jgi:hypothetical protein
VKKKLVNYIKAENIYSESKIVGSVQIIDLESRRWNCQLQATKSYEKKLKLVEIIGNNLGFIIITGRTYFFNDKVSVFKNDLMVDLKATEIDFQRKTQQFSKRIFLSFSFNPKKHTFSKFLLNAFRPTLTHIHINTAEFFNFAVSTL